jgi:hypothetical protein
VCYPLAHPGRYTAAEVHDDDAASTNKSLRVVRHEIPMILLFSGVALTALVSAPLAIALIANAVYSKQSSVTAYPLYYLSPPRARHEHQEVAARIRTHLRTRAGFIS